MLWSKRIRAELRRFTTNDSGAISVDWVVLTATLIGMVFLGLATIEGGIEEIARRIADALIATEVG